jgi:hypothetical protein
MSQQRESHSHRTVTTTGLCTIAAAALIALAGSGCGAAPAPESGPAGAVNVTVTSPPHAAHKRRSITRTRVVYAAAPPTASATTAACGNGIAVGPATSCAFAVNVRTAFEQHGPGIVRVYSPVTRRTYAMSCSSGAPTVCTGANHASMWF